MLNSLNSLEPGFYWVKTKAQGRWEVAEYDGVHWNTTRLYVIGPRIQEPVSCRAILVEP